MDKIENNNFKFEKDLLSVLIETERLLLKPISLKYKDGMFVEFNEEITTLMYPKPADDISEIEEFIESSIKGLKNGSNLQLVVLDKEGSDFLGCAGLHHIDRSDPELGVWIKKSVHGQAFGKEAMQAIKDWADDNLDYDYILYPVAENNIASRKIAESLGGKIVKEYNEINKSGKRLNIVEYRIYNEKKKDK